MQSEQKTEEKILTPYVEEFLKRYELQKVHIDFMQRVILLVIAGLGLITALAWDEMFKEIFKELFGDLPSLEERLIYALFLTLGTVTVTIIL